MNPTLHYANPLAHAVAVNLITDWVKTILVKKITKLRVLIISYQKVKAVQTALITFGLYVKDAIG
jgi:hypothetical protein